MKKTVVALACAAIATTSFIVRSHAQTASENLYFYGARLPSETVEVTAYSREGDKVEIKGNITLTSDQWVAFADAVVQAGFPASQGEPTPVTSAGPKKPR